MLNSDEGWVPPKDAPLSALDPGSTRSCSKLVGAHVQQHGVGELGHLVHRDGRSMSRWQANDQWKRIRAATGMPAVRYHDLRHHFASELLSSGLSVVAVARLLGDTPAVVLSTYGHVVALGRRSGALDDAPAVGLAESRPTRCRRG